MKKIELEFQNGIQKFIDLFNSILEKSNYNLNQYVKGDSLAITDDVSEEFFEELKEFMDVAPDIIKEVENKEKFWVIFEQLDDYESINKFINWLARYIDATNRPFEQATFLNELGDDSFNKMAEYCFQNLILQDIGKKNIDKSWDMKQMTILRKIMFTFVEMVVVDNLSKEYAYDNMQRIFGIKRLYCAKCWELVQEHEEKLWRIMMAKQYKRIEKKIDILLEAIEE